MSDGPSHAVHSPHEPPRADTARARAEALSDRDLVLALRAGDDAAWSTFYARAHGILSALARRTTWRGEDSSTCVEDLLVRVADRLVSPTSAIPDAQAPYLVRAALRCRRAYARHLARQHAFHAALIRDDAGLGLPEGQGVVGSVMSDYTRRAAMGTESAGVFEEGSDPTQELGRAIVHRLLHQLHPHDIELLTWHAEGLPHRLIAGWLHITPAAAAKRAQRLRARIRELVEEMLAQISPEAQDPWHRQWRPRNAQSEAKRPRNPMPTPNDDTSAKPR